MKKMWLISIVCVSLWIQNRVNHGYLTLMPFQKWAAEHHGFNYIKTKSRIIFDSMCESLSHSYVAPKFGDIAIDTAFALLNYYNRGLYYGKNYHIYSVYRIATDERAVAVVPPVFKGIQEKYHKYFVEIGGIFALGEFFLPTMILIRSLKSTE